MRQTDQQSAVALALDDNAVAGALATLLRLAVGAAGRLFHDLGDSLGLIGGTVNLEIELRNHTPIECARQQLTNLALSAIQRLKHLIVAIGFT